MPPYRFLSPKLLLAILAKDTLQTERQIANAKVNLATCDNATELKAWLKTYKLPKKPRFDDLTVDDMPFYFQ